MCVKYCSSAFLWKDLFPRVRHMHTICHPGILFRVLQHSVSPPWHQTLFVQNIGEECTFPSIPHSKGHYYVVIHCYRVWFSLSFVLITQFRIPLQSAFYFQFCHCCPTFKGASDKTKPGENGISSCSISSPTTWCIFRKTADLQQETTY